MPVDPNRESWKPGMGWAAAIDEIEYLRGLAAEMGGPARVERQHSGGRYTVRERIEKMADPGSFVEMGPLVGGTEYDENGNLTHFTPGGYVMGLAELDGRPVAIGGDDFTISGGSPHNVSKMPHDFAQPLALQYGIPYVQLREGVGHSSKQDEEDAFNQIKQFLSYLPNTTGDVAPRVETGDPPDRRPEELLHIIPENRRRGYDARALIELVVDNGGFFEMRRHYAGAVITGFARLDGYSVGILSSDPMKLAGAMDGDGADKYAHFVDLCDAFNLPVVIFLDMPGFMLGSVAERKATMRRGVRALIASAEADVPKVEFNVRKSYGVAADGPNSIGLPDGINLRFGWPAGEWGGIPIEGGVAAAYRREIADAPDPEAHRAAIEERLLRMRSPFKAAQDGDVVDLIDPRDTRRLACTFVKLAQPALEKLARRPKRAVRP
ncbi:MAG: hypothetical protein GY698_11090 [Actinomycetia bacterium]|nr:hypothetical protein [Actinomycetes bacterium]